MTLQNARTLRGLWHGESGQALPIVGFMMMAVLGMTALVLDVGHAYFCYRELQSSCDAAALAGATMIPISTAASTVIAKAKTYSAVAGNLNVYANLPNVTFLGDPVLKCLTSMQALGISCVGYLPYNAIQVKEQAVIPTYFAKLIGFPTMTISTTSTAVKGGGPSRPYNIVLMLDTTLSMNTIDGDCGGATQMACTLTGVQTLLQHLDPCGTSQATCTVTAGNAANSVARVSIFTFPQMTYPTVHYDTDCNSSFPTATLYTFPPAAGTSYIPGTANNSTTYRVIDFQSDYRASDTSTSLYQSSLLTVAAGGSNGCAGMGPPSNAGDYGTYYAATIYAAQAALLQAQVANPGSQNVMIIIGDGNANAPQTFNGHTVMGTGATNLGTYPSWVGECGQAIKATAAASQQGTTVYTVAYGAPASGCSTDVNAGTSPNISPCNEMAAMASHSWDFFSDYKQTGSGSTCVAAQTEVALYDIFLQIAGDLTEARLITDTAT